MASKSRILIRFILLAAVSSLLLPSGCQLLIQGYVNSLGSVPAEEAEEPESAFSQITCETETVTLAWDPSTSEVSSYKVFYREHGTADWSLFTEIPAQADPTVALHQADFGNGSFDFGVEAVADTGAESPMHSSLDATAQPTSGWYLTWDL